MPKFGLSDNTAPSGGSVTSPAGATTSTSVAVSFAVGTDTDSGVGQRALQRGTAALSGTTYGDGEQHQCAPRRGELLHYDFRNERAGRLLETRGRRGVTAHFTARR
ncbi:hypothetical protein [Cryobacterium sp. TMS1-13-1]|uniref:hypothetical protein n=1 Tax=Cryobacterium sp. TMS1-13-1 TaxID=1259220 RepID=UPI0010695DB8|nr:hypothetical protein [Cryobacterium sp. TMS1-13-1]TFD22142.1 hypothetical protein E3T31_08655 [Cryobacterium sp. TMS1-13-1]